ncbi:MAG TPA: rhodanese-like domain-containing protein [Polyangiaceae bacterium]|nr:rhodanese-like domain-containing protein [Polyangiaceae bacterium]
MSHRPLVLIAVVSLFACAKAEEPSKASAKLTATAAPSAAPQTARDPHAGLPQLSVDEVADLLAKHQARAVDANGAETRQQYGTLPGAVLLSNYATFETSELPSDKSAELVFYCGGLACSAAPHAAARAKEAGYTNVKVMPQGISGWVKAGKPIS